MPGTPGAGNILVVDDNGYGQATDMAASKEAGLDGI
jgi:hypothetical protein